MMSAAAVRSSGEVYFRRCAVRVPVDATPERLQRGEDASYPRERPTMTEVKAGDEVAIHYKGTLVDGSVFDSSEGRDPLSFTVGSGQIIPGLDKALPGMKVGDKKTVVAVAAEAYGEHDPQNMQQMPRANIPDDIALEVGAQLQVQTENGQVMQVLVGALDEETVTLDANHPLAGEDLTFAIELVSIG